MNPAQRSLRARIAAHSSWALTEDPAERTAPARKAALERFERQVDPAGVLSPEERSRRAAHAKKAYFAGLALRSAQARGAKKPPGTTPRASKTSAEHRNAASDDSA